MPFHVYENWVSGSVFTYVPQEPRMKTAKTQPFPIGDSFVLTCPEPGSVE